MTRTYACIFLLFLYYFSISLISRIPIFVFLQFNIKNIKKGYFKCEEEVEIVDFYMLF